MESAPPPPTKLLTPVSITSVIHSEHARASHVLQVVIWGGPVGDSFWPELNKVFLIFSVAQKPSVCSVRGREKALQSYPACERVCAADVQKNAHACRMFPKHWETRAFNIEESSGNVYLPATRHRFRISCNNFTCHFWCEILGNQETTNTNSPETHNLLFFPPTRKAPCFYSTYVTDLPEQTHFYVDASSVNIWCAFFLPFMSSQPALLESFFSVILVAGSSSTNSSLLIPYTRAVFCGLPLMPTWLRVFCRKAIASCLRLLMWSTFFKTLLAEEQD